MTQANRNSSATALECSYNPFVSPQLENPFPIWESARCEAPVFFSEVLNAWVVTRYSDVQTVLRDPQTFSSELGIRMSSYLTKPSDEVARVLAGVPSDGDVRIVFTDPPRHGRLRQAMQQAFLPKNVSLWDKDFRSVADELIDEMLISGGGEFYNQFANPYALGVLGALLRLPMAQMQQIKAWADGETVLKYGNPSEEDAQLAARARLKLYEFCVALIEERRSFPQDDFMSKAIQESDASEDPLSQGELVGQVMSLLIAGHETAANWLTMAVELLLQDGEESWKQLAADPDSVSAAVEETLRLAGPAQSIWRTPTVDVEVGGVRVPKGALVLVALLSANRDSDVFDDPDEYEIERVNARRHVAFGSGIHVCVGAGVARQEGRIALAALAQRVPRLRIDPRVSGMTFTPSAVQRMPRNLHLLWD
jgi:cytochrome P450